MVTIRIGKHTIGTGNPCFIIAEAGVNHNGSIDLAFKLVDAASAAGADAVKFQTFRAESLVTTGAPKASYQKDTTGAGESQFDMIKRLELPFEAFAKLQEHCSKRAIMFLSTPFDDDAVDYLAMLDVPAFKVASSEVTNHPLLERVAAKAKPVILSTGMCTLEEVREAVKVIRGSGGSELALLHCVSNYPANPSDVNLRAMETMQRVFNLPVGYSDHTTGTGIPIAAVALGASIIEKHFTLDRGFPGPDHRASLDPEQFAFMVRGIRDVEAALGDGEKRPAAAEAEIAGIVRRSLVAVCDVPAGTCIEKVHLLALRPSGGIPPNMEARVVGRQAARLIKAGAQLSWEDLQ